MLDALPQPLWVVADVALNLHLVGHFSFPDDFLQVGFSHAEKDCVPGPESSFLVLEERSDLL